MKDLIKQTLLTTENIGTFYFIKIENCKQSKKKKHYRANRGNESP